MPQIWIEVTDASGNRYGNGSIMTATGWQSTRPLDAIGTRRPGDMVLHANLD